MLMLLPGRKQSEIACACAVWETRERKSETRERQRQRIKSERDRGTHRERHRERQRDTEKEKLRETERKANSKGPPLMFSLLAASSTNDFQPTLSLFSLQVPQPLITGKFQEPRVPQSHCPEARLPRGT